MHEIATFGAGCFWGVEWVFRKVPGVVDAVTGYAGGTMADPTYRAVCAGTTGHAEVVDVTFDADVVTYEQLLEVFWAMHDPTQVTARARTGATQYRSVILVRDDAQRDGRRGVPRPSAGGVRAADRDEIRGRARSTPAEDYHQRYYEGNGHEPYCHVFPTGVVERARAHRPGVSRSTGRPRRRPPVSPPGSRRPCARRRRPADTATRRSGRANALAGRDRPAALVVGGPSHRPPRGPARRASARAPAASRVGDVPARTASARSRRARPRRSTRRAPRRSQKGIDPDRPHRQSAYAAPVATASEAQRSPSCTSRPSGAPSTSMGPPRTTRIDAGRAQASVNPTALCDPSQNGLFSECRTGRASAGAAPRTARRRRPRPARRRAPSTGRRATTPRPTG